MGILLWIVGYSFYSGYTLVTKKWEVKELGYLIAHVLRNIIELDDFLRLRDVFSLIGSLKNEFVKNTAFREFDPRNIGIVPNIVR